MDIVKAALEGFAHRYSALGIRIGESDARALVSSVVRQENPRIVPDNEEVDKLSRDLMRRIDDLAREQLLGE